MGHEPDGELLRAFFDQKVEHIFSYAMSVRCYTRHVVTDARAAVFRAQMEEGKGTKVKIYKKMEIRIFV